MAEIDFLSFIFTAGISSIIGGGSGLIIVVVLSKKLMDQILKKDIERYKTELLCNLKLNQEISKFNFDEETKIIKSIWSDIENICAFCAKHCNDEDDEILNELNKKLKESLSKNIPFIHEDIEKSIVKLIEISNIENYSQNKYSEIATLKAEIINTMRIRMHIF